MKKSLTLALALVALATFAALSVAPQNNERIGASCIPCAKGCMEYCWTMIGPVTRVNLKDKTFAVEENFFAQEQGTLPALKAVVDVTFTGAPSGPFYATTVKGSKSNSSYRIAPGGLSLVTGTVTKVDTTNKAFTIEVRFSGAKLNFLPKVGKTYDIAFTQETPGGTPVAMKCDSSRITFNPAL